MKKLITTLVVLSAVVVMQSGCLCVYAVKSAGTHRRYLKTTGIWTNANGNVMVECALLDRSDMSRHPRKLGTRLICASPATWDKAISTEVERQRRWALRYRKTNRVDHIFIHPAVSLSTTNPASVIGDGFVLFPPDLESFSEVTPPTLDWTRQPIPKNASNPSFSTSVSNQTISVFIAHPSLPRDVQRYKSWWWYPNQILLVPAYAVDIVTFPIQFLFIMNALSTIGG